MEEKQPVFNIKDNPELTTELNKSFHSRGNTHNREVGKPTKLPKESLDKDVEVDGKKYKNVESYFEKEKLGQVIGYRETNNFFQLALLVVIVITLICMITGAPENRLFLLIINLSSIYLYYCCV